LKLAQLADVQGVRVEFRAGWPNAYALPGNIMLLTDDLFSLMGGEGNEYLVDAIVAHELGHMKNRHIARKLVSQQLLTEVVLKMNGQSGQTTQVAGLANGLFLAPHFSRQHEAEADDFAFNLLQRSGQSPKYFSVAMQKFQFFQRAKMQEGSFTSSHPLTDSRIKAAHEAIDNSMVVDAYCKEDVSKKILNCTVEEFDGNRIIASHSYVKYTPNGQQ
jgi:predicted Zn-dependent protease